MRVPGYRLKGYDASYEQVNFDVKCGTNATKNCVLEVTDILSGVTFIFEIDEVLKYRIKRSCNI